MKFHGLDIMPRYILSWLHFVKVIKNLFGFQITRKKPNGRSWVAYNEEGDRGVEEKAPQAKIVSTWKKVLEQRVLVF